MPPSVPALVRGIALLRLLEGGARLSLEEIVRRSGFPKASAFRLCATLVALDLVERDPGDKTYRARSLIVPLQESDTDFDAALGAAIGRLAAAAGRTAEWYVPASQGMVLVKRREPTSGEVRVTARIGYVREWRGELDAVGCLGRAWWPDAPKSAQGLWWHTEDGVRGAMSKEEVFAFVAKGRQAGYATDPQYNTNGVRRYACVVLRRDSLAGVLASAQSYAPGTVVDDDEAIRYVVQEARGLSCDSAFLPGLP